MFEDLVVEFHSKACSFFIYFLLLKLYILNYISKRKNTYICELALNKCITTVCILKQIFQYYNVQVKED